MENNIIDKKNNIIDKKNNKKDRIKNNIIDKKNNKKDKIKNNKKDKIKNNKNIIRKNKNIIEIDRNINFDIQLKSLYKSIYINYKFYFTVLVCATILFFEKYNKKSLVSIIFSIIAISCSGYFIHLISHKINLTKLVDNSNIIFKHIPYIKYILKYLVEYFDFHSIIHHDNSKNKNINNIIYEFLNNFCMQGLNIFIVIKILKYIDERICFIWGLTYASIHNINYLLYNSKVHIDHHLNPNTNYGIDIFDIIFGTKSNWDDIEDINHYSYNIIIITIIICILNYYFNKYIKIKSL